ncbi:integrin alpha-3 [Trichomycterus rosablanca]|uniref:integrin alpha-3 n=1 Tax=Trichomycterus rosablanca TaxID=2290929 RepID=UPI002F34F59A
MTSHGARRLVEVIQVVPVLVQVLVLLGEGEGLNVDSRFAVVKEGNTAGGLFGFSVALHHQTVGGERYLLLVGAPQEKAEASLSANRTGDMFACPITSNPKDCVRANLISSETPDKDGVIEGMWLGVTVASQNIPGGRVMACGHRYTRMMDSGMNMRMIGKCFIRGNDLTYDEENDYQWQYSQEVCSPEGNHFLEGMCTMGISATITSTEVVAGAPGCYNWQGNSFVLYWDPDVEYVTEKMKLPNMNKGNIYIGYSVGKDSGLLSRNHDTVVTGAPRDDSKGSVMLLKLIEKDDGTKDLQTVQVLEGEQIGSYFGNSIAIVDINNDGWKELIVGAPFYFNRRKEEGGAVYVYMNENGSFSPRTDHILTGPKESGFGMAVSAIGDVNQDGFHDFAVGAPYHGTGRVCVWLGGKDGLSPKPNQVIEGKDVSNGGFKTFGYSISGGLDVDNNKYPDFIVGSLDDRVALLRARPVIHVKTTFSVTPPIVNIKNCGSCIKAMVCFLYTISTGDPNFNEKITMEYTVEVDAMQRSRVLFTNNNKNTHTGSIILNSQLSQYCDTHTLSVQEPVENKVSPVIFTLNASLLEPSVGAGGQTVQNLNLFPVLSQKQTLTDKTEIHFQKSCGEDNQCESNLQMSAAFARNQNDILPFMDGDQILQYNSSLKKLMLLINVTNSPLPGRLAEDAHNTELNISIPSSLRFSGIRPEASVVVDCDPEGTFILCVLGNPFTTNQMARFAIIFEPSSITLDTQQIISTLQLSTLSLQNDLAPLNKVLIVDYTLQTSFIVAPPRVQTDFSGTIVGESAMKQTADIGSPVQFKFTVVLDGPPLRNLAQLYVEFNWPLEAENGKWLLYISEISMRGTSESSCVPAGNIVNSLGLQVSETESFRRKRDESTDLSGKSGSPTPLHLQTMARKKVQLKCGENIRCKTFSCFLHNMTNSATVTVQGRLWNSTMLEDFKDVSVITIMGEASLKLSTNKPTIHLNEESTRLTFTVEVTPVIEDEAVYQVPLWIIIVSALAGVLLLTFIILLLWKCGFFRRASTREMYEAKSQKAEMKTQPSDKDRLTEE